MVNRLSFFLRKFVDRQNAGLTDERGWLVLSSPHTSSTIFSIVNAPFFTTRTYNSFFEFRDFHLVVGNNIKFPNKKYPSGFFKVRTIYHRPLRVPPGLGWAFLRPCWEIGILQLLVWAAGSKWSPKASCQADGRKRGRKTHCSWGKFPWPSFVFFGGEVENSFWRTFGLSGESCGNLSLDSDPFFWGMVF